MNLLHARSLDFCFSFEKQQTLTFAGYFSLCKGLYTGMISYEICNNPANQEGQVLILTS